MKRRAKKLTLSRETLNHLEQDLEQELRQAAGGVTITCMPPYGSCQYSGVGRQTCLTCVMTCTSNYC